MPRRPVLTSTTINQAVVKAQYAVRGEIALRAESLRTRLAQGEQLRFDKVVSCNIGKSILSLALFSYSHNFSKQCFNNVYFHRKSTGAWTKGNHFLPSGKNLFHKP